jgi:hypothetical protein
MKLFPILEFSYVFFLQGWTTRYFFFAVSCRFSVPDFLSFFRPKALNLLILNAYFLSFSLHVFTQLVVHVVF